MTFNIPYGVEDLEPFQVRSRREIINLLRSIGERNQLVRMVVNRGKDAIVTSILEIDESSGYVLVDCAPDAAQNQRILASDKISFETLLERIRILFSVEQMEACLFEGSPALRFPIPPSLVRLQRRESYRVLTPVSNPIRCTISVPHEEGDGATTVVLPLQNISEGGIGLLDENKQLDHTSGRIYQGCLVDLPGSPITVALQIRNFQDATLSNGKAIRRIGCMFIGLSRASANTVQRYITKLEREQNAKATGFNN